MWWAALCAELVADHVQHALHGRPCLRHINHDGPRYALQGFVGALSLAVTAFRQPSCDEPRYALRWRQIVSSKPATVRRAPDPMRQTALRTSSTACHLQ